jgi:DNA-binding response OmpR family regulator
MITKPSRNAVPESPQSTGERPAKPCASHCILLIEDDVQIGQLVLAEIRDAGWTVDWALDGRGGAEKFALGGIELVVLDLNLPDIDGLKVCEQIRANDHVTPILILSARAAREDVVRGLEMGADDYLTKPFDSVELIARMRALMRRVAAYRAPAAEADVPAPLRRGSLLIDQLKRETRIRGQVIELTAKEFELLVLFAKHPGRTFTRDELLRRVWGDGFEGYEHTVNTHINRLRSKVEADPKKPTLIETVWGVGYRFVSQSL